MQMVETHRNDAVVVHHDPVVFEAMKARVLGSKTSIVKHLDDPPRDTKILRRHVIRPGIDYRWAELPQTSFKAATFDMVMRVPFFAGVASYDYTWRASLDESSPRPVRGVDRQACDVEECKNGARRPDPG
ncbi:hypothetical protein [Bradyrhizobium japonicum]|uniref:hypothetical protein n=1 Tax=Bradyrhizobium japonicum TaxID=375 RepID=UPI003B66F7A0